MFFSKCCKQKLVYLMVHVIVIIVLVIIEKGYFNWFNSKSTIVVGVFVKLRNLCASFLLLEDCRRSLGVRLVQRSNNSENVS